MTRRLIGILACFLISDATPAWSAESVTITDVPDYTWYAGCFGSASGNLMGYWDRHGFPRFYIGPTAGGVAPLDSFGLNAGIRSLWASKAGFDGRPPDQPGHLDDYWEYYIDEVSYSYESTAPDPYVTAGRPEHPPDCLGDFTGASQNKWADLDGECSGNIDAFSFVFWDKTGSKRHNYAPPPDQNGPVRDIQSGFKAWTEYKGSSCDVFSQLAEFNPNVPPGLGFHFEDLKAEIDAGYPVLIFMQNPDEFSRSLPGNPRANPRVHGMVAYGYILTDSGAPAVRYRTSWGSGDNSLSLWTSDAWEAGLAVRGFITYHPLPKITEVKPGKENIVIKWEGPSSTVTDSLTGASTPVNWYVVEKTQSLTNPNFAPISAPSLDHEATIPTYPDQQAFFRVKLLTPEQAGQSR